MTLKGAKAGLLILIALIPGLYAAEEIRGQLGATSTGIIELSLEITEDISAGLLQTNLDEENSEFRTMLSTQMVQGLLSNSNTTLPLCVMSQGGGYFEVTSYEIPGEEGNQLISGFGGSVPVTIRFGEEELATAKHKAVTEECTQSTAISVTIQLNKQLSGEEVGRIYGHFNLLIKSE